MILDATGCQVVDALYLRNRDGVALALDHVVTVRRGQGYTLRVSAAPSMHRQLLARCQPLDGSQGARRSRQRKARFEYENRVSTLVEPRPEHHS